MTLARSQDTRSTNKNQTYFYALAMCNQKPIFQEKSFTTAPENEHLGINLTKDVKVL